MPAEPAEITLRVSGMVCHSCEGRIEKRLLGEPGVRAAKADYRNGTLKLVLDAAMISTGRIGQILADMDYETAAGDCRKAPGKWEEASQAAGLLLFVAALFLLANRFGLFEWMNIFPEAEAGMGFGMLFLIGLLTSTHCLAMCGGINLSQTAVKKTPAAAKGLDVLMPSLLYGGGRVASYAAVGALIGALGSVVSFSGGAKGMVQIAAGLFMMIMGLNLIGSFPWLRRLMPRLPRFFSGGAGRGPLYVGLLTGLMPCGPLQAMQLYALSTGSPVQGGLSMLFFSLGTLPLPMGLGIAGSLLGQRWMGKTIRIGAALVFIMGLGMLGNGLRLSGFAMPDALGGGEAVAGTLIGRRQVVNTKLSPGSYQAIRVRPGIPIEWHIHAENGTLNGCNNRIFIPAFNIERKLALGDNIIEFTPEAEGVYPFSCWMGMISSRIVVGDMADDATAPELDRGALPAADAEYNEVPWL
ncbi:MAG: sulfite exporter TauE/SafE family protein [Planctomycetota bacterium]|jgi:sulfite exporter TauE/SafE/copper chaperone CopZ|nr:sulfite exporter TauE/SafE family protein [Planctomycetota bacterium]